MRLAPPKPRAYIALQATNVLPARSITMFERIAIRAVALGLSGLITLTIVSALANTADQHHAQACLAYAQSFGAVQHVVVVGQRQRRG
jgi:hypothetical protein